jgi:hypothetical protein
MTSAMKILECIEMECEETSYKHHAFIYTHYHTLKSRRKTMPQIEFDGAEADKKHVEKTPDPTSVLLINSLTNTETQKDQRTMRLPLSAAMESKILSEMSVCFSSKYKTYSRTG